MRKCFGAGTAFALVVGGLAVGAEPPAAPVVRSGLAARVFKQPATPALELAPFALLPALPDAATALAAPPIDIKPPGKSDDKIGLGPDFPSDSADEARGGDRQLRPDITAALNQRINIRPEKLGERIDPDSVVIDRPELFLPVSVPGQRGVARPFGLSPDGFSLILQGVRLGQSHIRVFNPKELKAKPISVLVQIVPDVDYLNRLVHTRFPMANLTVTAAGDNILFVDGAVENPGEVEEVERLLGKFFKGGVVNNVKVAGVMQVQLEVVIARVDRTQLRQLGFNVLANNAQSVLGTQIGNLISTPQVTLPTVGSKVFSPIGPNQAALTGSATAFFGVTDQSKALYGFIEALRQHNLAKILANPTLVTFSGRQADFLVGGEQPIPVAGTITSPTVNFKAFGTRLTFLPTVLGGGKIRLDVVPEVSTTNFANSVTVGGLQVPQFVVQRLHATVELQSGQTLCLGGLLQSEIDAQSQKIPFLGELPVVGALFRRVRHSTREVELLVLITPRLFNPLEGCQVPTMVPGQSTVSPNDAQLFGHGALESTSRDGGPPIGPHKVPLLGDFMGASAVPRPVSSCKDGSNPNGGDVPCPPAPAGGAWPQEPASMPAPTRPR